MPVSQLQAVVHLILPRVEEEFDPAETLPEDW